MVYIYMLVRMRFDSMKCLLIEIKSYKLYQIYPWFEHCICYNEKEKQEFMVFVVIGGEYL